MGISNALHETLAENPILYIRGTSMVLRKINAGVSLLTTVLLLFHAISISVWMLSRGAIEIAAGFMAWVLMGATVIHALISIDLAMSAHEGVEKRKCKKYPKLNASTMVQRISGVLMLVFTGLHVTGAMGLMQPPQAVHAVVPPLFFALALTHAAVSTSKAFITLGIGNAKFVKGVDIAIKVICGATLVACVVGFYLHVY